MFVWSVSSSFWTGVPSAAHVPEQVGLEGGSFVPGCLSLGALVGRGGSRDRLPFQDDTEHFGPCCLWL